MVLKGPGSGVTRANLHNYSTRTLHMYMYMYMYFTVHVHVQGGHSQCALYSGIAASWVDTCPSTAGPARHVEAAPREKKECELLLQRNDD